MTTDYEWLPPAEWYASLPAVLVAAGGLVTAESGEVLLVKPNYRDHWSFPGGIVDDGEAPHAACAREVREEVGLDLPVGDLLVVNWLLPEGDRKRAMLHMIFDCGTVPVDAAITLQTSELDAYAFLAPAEAAARLDPRVSSRLPAALRARETGHTAYQVTNLG
jgi:ADP-ribose pyrophosphatase YjhB (NUDIX family)